jgi:hypothetical protein
MGTGVTDTWTRFVAKPASDVANDQKMMAPHRIHRRSMYCLSLSMPKMVAKIM